MCCTTLGVTELCKNAGDRCEHVREGGCTIYSDRPPTCRGYGCGWYRGSLGDEDRPDKVGFICDTLTVAEVGMTVLIRISRDDAELKDVNSPVAKLLSLLVQDGQIVTLHKMNGSELMLGDPEKMKQFINRAREVA